MEVNWNKIISALIFVPNIDYSMSWGLRFIYVFDSIKKKKKKENVCPLLNHIPSHSHPLFLLCKVGFACVIVTHIYAYWFESSLCVYFLKGIFVLYMVYLC